MVADEGCNKLKRKKVTLSFQKRKRTFLHVEKRSPRREGRVSAVSVVLNPLDVISRVLQRSDVQSPFILLVFICPASSPLAPGFCSTLYIKQLILYQFSFWFKVLFKNNSNAKRPANQRVFRRAVVYPDPKPNKIFVWE